MDSEVLVVRYIGEKHPEPSFTPGKVYSVKTRELDVIDGKASGVMVFNTDGPEHHTYLDPEAMDLFRVNFEEVVGGSEPEAEPTTKVAAQEEHKSKSKIEPKSSDRRVSVLDTEASDILDPNTWLQMKSIAKDFFDSGVVPPAYQNPLQVLMGLQYGKEMGMSPAESLQSLVPINGMFGVWGKAVPNRLRQHGWAIKYEEGGDGDNQYCKAIITRDKPYEQEYSETITFAEVAASGYTLDKYGKLKPGWKPGLNRRLKLRYDVLDVLIKTYVPEVYGAAAGVAEMLFDIPEDEDKNISEKKREVIQAALDKRKELDTKAFKPKVVENVEAESSDETTG